MDNVACTITEGFALVVCCYIIFLLSLAYAIYNQIIYFICDCIVLYRAILDVVFGA